MSSHDGAPEDHAAPAAPVPAARYVRAAAHGGILALALILARDVLADDGVPVWPDKGFPLLVVVFALVTAVPAMIRSLRMPLPDWGENLASGLPRGGQMRLAVFAAAWLGFAFALPVFGFLVTATTAIAVTAVAIGQVRPWLAVLSAVVMAVFVFWTFQFILYVGFPLGPLDRFLMENLPGR